MGRPTVAVSAPGKVLLTGGYLVLDRKYTGLVFGLSARIHVLVRPLATTPGVTFSEITVQSPQFKDAVWEYGYRMSNATSEVQVTQLRADADLQLNRNPFIETALAYALTYIYATTSEPIEPSNIIILADNDYYSTSGESLVAGRRFHNFGVPVTEAHKTGLGSSAALVTSFTAAVLSYYLPKEKFNLDEESSRRRLHNLAQASHCAAQGKVGSGFDVASAVYGSCLYRRFSPDVLSGNIDLDSKGFASQLKDTVNEAGSAQAWDTEIVKDAVKVPKGLRLVMCDVDCGSQTPGMVKKVLGWRAKERDVAEKAWDDLQAANEDFVQELKKAAESGETDYSSLHQRIQHVRKHIRNMGAASDVPIEPPAQTRLLDACTELSGVVGGVVPGAGGYDAVALLIEDTPEVFDSLKRLLTDWEFEGSGDAGAGGRVNILGVREEMEGVRTETADEYLDCLP